MLFCLLKASNVYMVLNHNIIVNKMNKKINKNQSNILWGTIGNLSQ